MVEKGIRMESAGGVHLTPAEEISETAMQFRCHSELIVGEKTYNLRSVLSVLSLLGGQCSCGRDAVLRCDGTDEDQASRTLAEILEASPVTDREE